MTPFGFLILAHLIGDFLFQTGWMAKYKATRWLPLVVHVSLYTSIIAFISWIGFGGLSLLGIIIIFVSHILLDRRGFVRWWVTTIMRATGDESKWLKIVVDQVFHIIVLAIVLYV